jgi:hypothetical protein
MPPRRAQRFHPVARDREVEMSKFSRAFVPLTLAAALWVAPHVAAAEGPTTPLVDVAWLAKNLANPDIVVLDASPRQLYAVKHIPARSGSTS